MAKIQNLYHISFEHWKFEFGIYLGFGCWDLEFQRVGI